MAESPHPTRLELARQFVMSIGDHELDGAIELLSAHVSYHVLGDHALAGTFSGPEEVRTHLMNLDDRTRGTFDAIKWDDWLVGEDHVAALATISMLSDGRRFSGRDLFLVRFDEADKIDAITVFAEDEASALRFFGPAAPPEDR